MKHLEKHYMSYININILILSIYLYIIYWLWYIQYYIFYVLYIFPVKIWQLLTFLFSFFLQFFLPMPMIWEFWKTGEIIKHAHIQILFYIIFKHFPCYFSIRLNNLKSQWSLSIHPPNKTFLSLFYSFSVAFSPKAAVIIL